MGKGKTVGVAIMCLLVGTLFGFWIAPHMNTQAIPETERLDIQRQGDFLLVRDTHTGTCFLSLKGGGIVPMNCVDFQDTRNWREFPRR
jgi:hypothetical protein